MAAGSRTADDHPEVPLGVRNFLAVAEDPVVAVGPRHVVAGPAIVEVALAVRATEVIVAGAPAQHIPPAAAVGQDVRTGSAEEPVVARVALQRVKPPSPISVAACADAVIESPNGVPTALSKLATVALPLPVKVPWSRSMSTPWCRPEGERVVAAAAVHALHRAPRVVREAHGVRAAPQLHLSHRAVGAQRVRARPGFELPRAEGLHRRRSW
jgi:hypothetical protein